MKGIFDLRFRGVKAYQKPLTKTILAFRDTHKTFIDIGAAEGDIVEAVMPYFDSIVAIEPAPHHYKTLQNKQKNGQLKKVKILNLAAGQKNGTAKLGISNTNPDDNSLFKRDDLTKYIKVKQKTLDSIVADCRIKNRVVVKMDVQGFEGHILKGATRTLQTGSVIIMEFWPWGLLQAGENPMSVVNFLQSKNFCIANLNHKELSFKKIERIVHYGLKNRYVVADLLIQPAIFN